ncbi:MAG: selenide, water dikinase SelD [Firmicutes bacterium]|nr:selenide, water dikinase SelD [Bacillota bacterium]
MDLKQIQKLNNCGGCAAKLSSSLLKEIVSSIPKFDDKNLIVGFDSSDDGAVYKIDDNTAIIQTLDFFPPIVPNPYIFGQIAAANSVSDVYAMGGKVLSALNIVCFNEEEDPSILAAILKGGAEKIKESGGVLCGGHSINDDGIKYGLSVNGLVHPDKILYNNRCKIGDKIILTKPLGVGIVNIAHLAGQRAATKQGYEAALKSMTTLNKYAFELAVKYNINAMTDVTGFGFLGHLYEMIGGDYSIKVDAKSVVYIKDALNCAEEFLITAGGQKNRESLEYKVNFDSGITEALKEIFYDPQTSGGLLISADKKDANKLMKELSALDLESSVVGEVVKREEHGIIVI